MNILMVTNTFTPHVGGVARSVEAFTAHYRKRGHSVMVIAPVFERMPEREQNVVRIPAIQHFNGSDFSVVLPLSRSVSTLVDGFAPDIIHSHHPFLLGGTALRLARSRNLPLVFTHHTMYEQYTHYVPGDSRVLGRFVIRLSTSYANLCDRIFAPSASIAAILRERGVMVPIEVVSTGVDLDRFAGGSGSGFRSILGIPDNALVVGHVGRLAPEKNPIFLAHALVSFLRSEKQAHCLVVGEGPSRSALADVFREGGVADRLHLSGVLEGAFLTSAYRAMDVFAFASKSETQGMVLTEAMAAGVPVVALDAPGAREVIVEGVNGKLLEHESVRDFASALEWFAALPRQELAAFGNAARQTATEFSIDRSVEKALAAYRHLIESRVSHLHGPYEAWERTLRLIRSEWRLMRGMAEGSRTAAHGRSLRERRQ